MRGFILSPWSGLTRPPRLNGFAECVRIGTKYGSGFIGDAESLGGRVKPDHGEFVMTRKQKRLSVIVGGLAILGLAAGLVLYALRDTIVFFYTPSEISEKNVQPGTAAAPWRPGGEGQHFQGGRHDDHLHRDRHDQDLECQLHWATARSFPRRAGRCGRRRIGCER